MKIEFNKEIEILKKTQIKIDARSKNFSGSNEKMI